MNTTTPVALQTASEVTALLNTIRANAGASYAASVPLADGSDDTVRLIGNAIIGSQALSNTFVGILVNQIALPRAVGDFAENQFKPFIKDPAQYEGLLQKFHINPAKPVAYNTDKANPSNPFAIHLPDIKVEMYATSARCTYPVTIFATDLDSAFRSNAGVADFVARLTKSLYDGLEWDRAIFAKWQIYKYMSQAGAKTVPLAVTGDKEADSKTLLAAVKAKAGKMRFNRTDANLAGVVNATRPENQYIMFNADSYAENDVFAFMSALQPGRGEVQANYLMTDDFTLSEGEIERLKEFVEPAEAAVIDTVVDAVEDIMPTITCVLMDTDFVSFHDKVMKMADPTYNNVDDYWNYVLHYWGYGFVCSFANGWVFTKS